MAQDGYGRIAILYPGDYEVRRNATAENNRFADLFRAFAAKGIHAEPAVYHDDFCAEVCDQLMRVDGVLVWINPIQGGRNRSILDSMREQPVYCRIPGSGGCKHRPFCQRTFRHQTEARDEGSSIPNG